MAEKKKDYRSLTVAELQNQAKDLAKELFVLRNELSLNKKLEKPHLLTAKRRERARILTLITEKERMA